METIDFFSTGPRMRGMRGDTFPVFRVKVSGMDLTGCTMRIVLERKDTPGSVELTKECTHFEDADGSEGYRVQLTTLETRNLLGIYTVHFILNDGVYWNYRKLVGTLEVLPIPQETTAQEVST